MKVPDNIMEYWKRNCSPGDKVRISRTTPLLQSTVTKAFDSWALPETIEIINKWFSYCRNEQPPKFALHSILKQRGVKYQRSNNN